MNYFYNNMRYIRKQRNLSMTKFGELLGCYASTIMRWEQNNNGAALDSVLNASEKLGIPVSSLVEKDLSLGHSTNPLDEILFSKSKDLSDEDKKVVISVIDSIKKDIDKKD